MVSLIITYCSAIYPLSRKLSELNIEKSAMQTFSNTVWIILVVFYPLSRKISKLNIEKSAMQLSPILCGLF
jgi:hypothetical protein